MARSDPLEGSFPFRIVSQRSSPSIQFHVFVRLVSYSACIKWKTSYISVVMEYYIYFNDELISQYYWCIVAYFNIFHDCGENETNKSQIHHTKKNKDWMDNNGGSPDSRGFFKDLGEDLTGSSTCTISWPLRASTGLYSLPCLSLAKKNFLNHFRKVKLGLNFPVRSCFTGTVWKRHQKFRKKSEEFDINFSNYTRLTFKYLACSFCSTCWTNQNNNILRNITKLTHINFNIYIFICKRIHEMKIID